LQAKGRIRGTAPKLDNSDPGTPDWVAQATHLCRSATRRPKWEQPRYLPTQDLGESSAWPFRRASGPAARASRPCHPKSVLQPRPHPSINPRHADLQKRDSLTTFGARSLFGKSLEAGQNWFGIPPPGGLRTLPSEGGTLTRIFHIQMGSTGHSPPGRKHAGNETVAAEHSKPRIISPGQWPGATGW
jgi:hypothetical protein